MHLTNLEKRLCADDADQYKQEILEELDAWRQEMARELTDPLAFEHFLRNLVLRDACAAAMRVVESIAQRMR
jgi:hypothetical protein